MPLVELVPAPWTSTEITEKAKAMQIECGQKPVVFHKEVEGFGINRLQYALLNECIRLVDVSMCQGYQYFGIYCPVWMSACY